MKLTENFNLNDFTVSQTAARHGIENEPGENEINNLKLLCEMVLEPIYAVYGNIIVTSGYRNSIVNSLIGGAKNSQHCLGQAADIIVPKMSAEKLFYWIIDDANLIFDQCIFEYGKWVHISYDYKKNRKQTFIAIYDGKNRYVPVFRPAWGKYRVERNV